MASIIMRRITKNSNVQVFVTINGKSLLTPSHDMLSHIFPGVEVIHGGLFLATVNLRLEGHHKCFAFEGGAFDPHVGVWDDVKRSVKNRLLQIREWVRTVPVMEEFTIEI
jgi:hypothetical protein